MKEFIVNEWHDSSTNGTSVLWRGSSEKEFREKQHEFIKRFKPEAARILETRYVTVFSFPVNKVVLYQWANVKYTFKPDFEYYYTTKELEKLY